MNYIIYSIPIFFVLIGVEFLVAALHNKRIYRLNDTINDLSCGITEQIVLAFSKTILLGVYVGIYHLFQSNGWFIVTPDNSLLWWVLIFLLVDFLYYWAHRLSHTMAIGWAGHSVHHQSEEFNLSVALRQGTFQPFFTFLFYLPLAMLGFTPLMYIAAKSFNALYQFWIHTRLIDKMGFLEWFMNTPSHHRVHHGRNDEYLDKNYAGIFIIWDRLFGTFELEKAPVSYGVTQSLCSWNPIWANVTYMWSLLQLSWQAPHFADKFKVWFKPPGWVPRDMVMNDEKSPLDYKYDPIVSNNFKIYAAIQFVIANFLAVLLLYYLDSLQSEKYLCAIFILFSLVCIGGLFENKRWAIPCEIIRIIALAVTLIYFFLPKML